MNANERESRKSVLHASRFDIALAVAAGVNPSACMNITKPTG